MTHMHHMVALLGGQWLIFVLEDGYDMASREVQDSQGIVVDCLCVLLGVVCCGGVGERLDSVPTGLNNSNAFRHCFPS